MNTNKHIAKFAPIALLVWAITGSVHAEVSDKNAPKLAEAFVEQIKVGDAAAAFALLQPHWPQSAEEINFQIDRAQNHINDRPPEWGAVTGVESYLTTDSGRKSILNGYSYLITFEYHAEIWNIQFYKNSSTGKWMVNEVQYQPIPNAF